MDAPRNNQRLEASFYQKSAGLSLVIVGSLALFYFAKAYELLQTGEAMPGGALRLALALLAGIIVVEIVLQTVLVIGAGQVPAATERDKRVARVARNNAYYVLIVGVLATFASAFFGATPFAMANVALLSLVLAEMTKFASHIVAYRRAEVD